MITTYAEYISLLDSNDNTDFQHAVHEAIAEDVLLHTIRERPDLKKWVIHNKRVPVSILILLSDDADDNVRGWVARKRKLPLPYLEKMAHDQSDGVRRDIVYHSKATKQILEMLAQDAETDIADHAQQRLATHAYK